MRSRTVRAVRPSARRVTGRLRAGLLRVGAAALTLVLVVALTVTTAPDAAAWGGRGLPRSYAAPPAPGGTMADLGSPMSSLTVVEGAFGLMDGRLVAYAAPMGENAALNVSTVTGSPTTQLGRYPMPGASGAPTIAVAPDQKVYVGTYYDGHLYEFDPVSRTMTDLGRVTADAEYAFGLSVAPDGTVYGGTYPDAKVWSYRPGAGFADLGRVTGDLDVKYTRTVYDPDHHALWVGTQAVAGLYRLDLATRAVTQVALTAPPKPVTSVPDLDYAEGRVIVSYGGYLRVIDAATATEVPVTDGDTGEVTTGYLVSGRGVSEPRRGGVYFGSLHAGAVHVVRYDLATATVRRTGHRATRGALIGFGWARENDHDVLYGFAGNYSGGAFRYDIDAGAAGSLQLQITPSPSPLQHLLPSSDGTSVLVNAFQNGNTSRYDVASGTSKPVTRLGQVEDWLLSGDTVHAGTYPNGALVSVPAAATSSTPLTTYTTLKDPHRQIRPIEAKEREGRIWYTTAPDYSERGGAVAVLDPATRTVDVTRGVVPDHTLAALEVVDGRVYLGSSTEGGTGTDPVPGEGRLVQWDPATKQVVRSIVPVRGARTVNALTLRNGKLWGLADSTLFVVDLARFRVERRLDLGVTSTVRAYGGEIVVHPNGYVYVSVGRAVIVVDPFAFTTATVAADGTQRLELSSDRTLWTLLKPDTSTTFLDLGRYTPAATPCPNPDTRDFVTLFGVQTRVRNRFVVTGCTLQDLFPLTREGTRSYAGTVNPWLDQMVASGAITRAERDELWRAAKRGR